MDISERLKIAQQLAFLEAGGGRKSGADQFGDLLSSLGGAATTVAKGIETGYEARKKRYESDKLAREATPFSERIGVPSADKEAQLKSMFDVGVQKAQSPQQKSLRDYLTLADTQDMSSEEIAGKTGLAPTDLDVAVAKQPLPQFESPRAGFEKEYGQGSAGLTLDELKDRATTRATESLATERKNKMPAYSNLPVGRVLPKLSANDYAQKFGPGVTAETPYGVALSLANLKEKQAMGLIRRNKAEALFPVAGLTPDAQDKALAAGFGKYITESQARILQVGTLPQQATTEEIKDIASMETLEKQIGRVKQLAQETNYDGIGVENYYINNFGQYVPIDAWKTDPKIVELYQTINDINNQMIYLRSGKQINEQEFARLASTFPEPQLNREAFVTRLDTFGNTFNDLSEARMRTMKETGRRLPKGAGMGGRTKKGTKYTVIQE